MIINRHRSRKHRYSLLFLLACPTALTTSSCSDIGDCPVTYFTTKGPSIKAITGEVTTIKAQFHGTTYNTPLQPPPMDYREFPSSGCYLWHHTFQVDGPQISATIPTRIALFCMSDEWADHLEVVLILPDLRNLSNGSFDLVALGGEWYTSWRQADPSISCAGATSHLDDCTIIPTTLVTFGLTIDGAAGGPAKSPANVSSDFHRTAHLNFHVTADSGADEMTVDVAVPFEQTSENYLCAEEVWGDGRCR